MAQVPYKRLHEYLLSLFRARYAKEVKVVIHFGGYAGVDVVLLFVLWRDLTSEKMAPVVIACALTKPASSMFSRS